jgi:phenylpyruvate tautomerase PptA (4-oxalocrotonate tautomerase family)
VPRVEIEVRKSYSREQEIALIDAVHAALVEAFKIRPTDKNVRLVIHDPQRFACSPDRTTPEAFTQISIDAIAGRSVDAKRALYRAIVRNLEPFGIPKDHVQILVRDLPLENWGIRGGQAAIDVDLGFDVKV